MSLDTVLLSVGDADETLAAALGDHVVDVAGPTGATVRLAHVFSEDRYGSLREKLSFDGAADVTPDLVAKRHPRLRELGRRLDEADIEHSHHGEVGTESDEVLAMAERFDADLVVIGRNERRSPAGKAVFGSQAQQVLLNAPCPVTLVRGPEPGDGGADGTKSGN